jgi:hypothetical protein
VRWSESETVIWRMRASGRCMNIDEKFGQSIFGGVCCGVSGVGV